MAKFKIAEQQTAEKQAYMITFTALIGMSEFDSAKKYRRSTSMPYESELKGLDFCKELKKDVVAYALRHFITEAARPHVRVLAVENLRWQVAPIIALLLMFTSFVSAQTCQKMYDIKNNEYSVSLSSDAVSVYQLKTKTPTIIQAAGMSSISENSISNAHYLVYTQWRGKFAYAVSIKHNNNYLHLYSAKQKVVVPKQDSTGNIPSKN